jgi:type I restriction enzyme M protein
MHTIKNYITALGFNPKEGKTNLWFKTYSSHKGYEIAITIKDDTNATIDFGNLIRIERKTTSSFNTAENLVVLECVNRLLEKGYKPQCMVLEKQWKLGHTGKGFLDIQVLDENEQSYLLIECKTWGKEFTKAEEETLKNGAQLFSYLQQEPNTKYLCLYTSKLEQDILHYRSNVIENIPEFRNRNQSEIFEVWDKVFEEKGIFEDYVTPYNIKFTELLKADLKTLEQEDGGKIFNLFAEILRRNVVSDKNNAFNKIFNLFLCKIVDEDKKADNQEMAFQWKRKYDKSNKLEENAGYKEFLGALNDLYKEGIKDYLQIEVTDHSQKEVEKLLQMLPSADDETKAKLKSIIEDLRFYKSNEFAFKEVNNKESFEENAKIVKEMVELLQSYKLKYSAKHQFLGDFFENLLNTGIKQESGQFFTPTPIASFICKSLPIWNIIEKKNNNGEVKFLPHLIDFASGSGHFLTEGMDEINYYVEKKISEEWIRGGKRAKDEFEAGKKSYKWAKEYIYGIEKDYRLAKTTKISSFLNGDGDANVICSDGIGSFKHDKKYIGLLKSDSDSRDNQKFDILIANPPYSVDEFKVTIENHGKDSFELFDGLSDQASEIECLFIERAKQLLNDGGVAGIILPISILSNGKIHMRARELILKYFEIKAVVEFGTNTFMATGTRTATLFLRRRNNDEWKIFQKMINEFFTYHKDMTVNGVENIFTKYVTHVFDGISLNDYCSLFTHEPTEAILSHEIIKDYVSLYKRLNKDKQLEAIKDVEKEKLLYFILTYNQKFVLVKSPNESSEEKEFLGYEFSNRRGHEGIKIYKDEKGNNVTKLFNSDFNNLYDISKVNSYILKAFELAEIPEPVEELRDIMQIQRLYESIDFNRVNFEKRIATEFSKKKSNLKANGIQQG